MKVVDEDKSGTIEFIELTRALQKLDLRVELHDYLLVALRFYCQEMQRAADHLKRLFEGAKGFNRRMNVVQAKVVNGIVKELDTNLEEPEVQRMIIEMFRSAEEADGIEPSTPSASKKKGKNAMAQALDPEALVSMDHFVKVCLAHGLGSVQGADD